MRKRGLFRRSARHSDPRFNSFGRSRPTRPPGGVHGGSVAEGIHQGDFQFDPRVEQKPAMRTHIDYCFSVFQPLDDIPSLTGVHLTLAGRNRRAERTRIRFATTQRLRGFRVAGTEARQRQASERKRSYGAQPRREVIIMSSTKTKERINRLNGGRARNMEDDVGGGACSLTPGRNVPLRQCGGEG